MKILFLTSWYPTTKDGYSGLFIKKHAEAVNSLGNEIVVLAIVIHRSRCLWRKKVRDLYDENGIRTVSIEIDTCFRDTVYHLIPLQYRIVSKHFRKKISESFSPDLIHSNVVFPAGIVGDKLARKMGLPHIITEHWSQLRKFLKKPLFSRMGVKAYLNAVRILPVSEFLKQEVIDSMSERTSQQNRSHYGETNSEHVPDSMQTIRENEWQYFNGVDKLRVIGNVVDSEIFKYKAKLPDENIIRLCTVGTWNRTRNITKNPELLIEAISILQTEFDKQIKLTFVGGGDKLEELKELCRNRGVDAEFIGYFNSSEVAAVIQSSDYMVHCSNVETFGIVVAEALMTGTPVICSNVGALNELMEEESGVAKGITCENTLDDWLHKLKAAFLWQFDNEAIAREMENKYSLNTIGTKLNEVYNELFCQIKKID